MLGPEGVIAAGAGVVVLGAREWRRVQLAREQRREREQELLAQVVTEVADGGREVQVRHGGAAGTWSVSCRGGTGEREGGRRRRGMRYGSAPVGGRTVPAKRRRR